MADMTQKQPAVSLITLLDIMQLEVPFTESELEWTHKRPSPTPGAAQEHPKDHTMYLRPLSRLGAAIISLGSLFQCQPPSG